MFKFTADTKYAKKTIIAIIPMGTRYILGALTGVGSEGAGGSAAGAVAGPGSGAGKISQPTPVTPGSHKHEHASVGPNISEAPLTEP